MPPVATWYSSGWNVLYRFRSISVTRYPALVRPFTVDRPAKPAPTTTTCRASAAGRLPVMRLLSLLSQRLPGGNGRLLGLCPLRTCGNSRTLRRMPVRAARFLAVAGARAGARAGAVLGDGDADRYLLVPFLSFSVKPQRADVLGGMRGRGQAARPQFPDQDDVGFGRIQRRFRLQVEPGDQAEHDAEGAIQGTAVRELVPDNVSADQLQDLPGATADDGPEPEILPGDDVRRGQPDPEPEQADVGR